VRYLYIILFYLALPFLFLRLLWRSRRLVDFRKRWNERLGFSPFKVEKSIWIHAASVGETLAAIPFVKGLQKQYPHIPVVLTNMTITGSARTQSVFNGSVLHSYIPYDVPDAARRFLKRCKPVVAIMMETELWPTIFAECKAQGIPVLIANARLSEKSAAGYHRVATVSRNMLDAVTAMAVQTQVEAERFFKLGLQANKVSVTGSIKFDVEVPENLTEKSEALLRQLGSDRLIWIAASTHGTEEEIILAAHKRISQILPQSLLILVPRHPQRFDDVFRLSEQQGFKTARRSKNETCTPDTQVYLGDTMGELLLLYSACDVAFVAGSFAKVGGHNMLEAAVLGKPVITGPELFNFAEISQHLIAAGGMLTVQDTEKLTVEIVRLLQDTSERLKMGENARAFVNANRGALTKHLNLAKQVIDESLKHVN
jgi:3-deoxy-D-manno-octulosonic-acid transferase